MRNANKRARTSSVPLVYRSHFISSTTINRCATFNIFCCCNHRFSFHCCCSLIVVRWKAANSIDDDVDASISCRFQKNFNQLQWWKWIKANSRDNHNQSHRYSKSTPKRGDKHKNVIMWIVVERQKYRQL